MNTKDFYTIYTEYTPSTMDLAKHYKNSHDNNNIIAVVTRNQTFGRGRGGSVWQQADLSILDNQSTAELKYYSDLTDIMASSLDFLPLTLIVPASRVKVPFEWITALVSCALLDALTTTGNFIKSTIHGLPFASNSILCIKWPNDLIFFNKNISNTEYKKVSGILCETSSQSGKIGDIFIGIGLNFFSKPDLDKAISFWESIFSNELNKNERRELNKLLKDLDFKKAIVTKFCDNFKKEFIDLLFSERNSSQIKSIVQSRSIPHGTFISVDKGTRKGEFIGLDDNGGLLLSGNRNSILSGNISIENPVNIKTKSSLNIELKSAPVFAIDFGNTTIHTTYQATNSKLYHANISYETIASENGTILRDSFKPLVEGLLADRKEKIELIYTTVNTAEKTKNSIQKIKDYFKSLFPEIIFNEIKLTEQDIFSCINISGNFEISRLGADRALKFLFAANEAKKQNINVLTFSFGTAVTCEGVSSKLGILENFVFPGIQMALNAINHFTALVPLFKANPELFQANNSLWNQEIYVQRGVFLSTAASVIATIEMHQPCKCYFSGGNSDSVLKIIELMYPNKNYNIEILPNIETEVIIKNKDNILKKQKEFELQKKHLINENILKIKNIIEEKKSINLQEQFKDKSISDIAKTMLKARDPKSIIRTAELNDNDFRKIGTHIEGLQSEERLDSYMANKFQFHNRETWRERIEKGEVKIEHGAHNKNREKIHLNKVKPTYKIKNFDQVWLFHPPEYEPDIIENIDVIYDNGDVCVFSKPPNMVIHAAGIYGKNTFVNIAQKMGYGDCAAVHRIDRETSGILACARKSETRNIISEAFRQGKVDKMYIAVTKGENDLPEKFRVTLPIGEPEQSLIRLKLWINGKSSQNAETWFAKLSQHEDYTLYACLPQTGRTNQIRIHLAAIGQWIVGDKMYHPNEQVFLEFYEKGYTDWVHEQTLFPRHMLHNTAINIAGESNISTSLEQPIVCELSEDMLNFDIVKKLLERAKIPINKIEQRSFFKNIFIQLNKVNFQNFPEISEGGYL
ncbi:type III pantothenate kinase [Pigmentibacter sp. JX0631]|uniref:type III pantothenate kinase n=1 Tax=Pigmentibacter sp. JX0631 TaxID=2976982 RepID=UPI0024687762|nr:type III pantothenate kinase [Pigmentibacter sp. JX0631]WGL61182.1 type III pantothenate kinase [Pigmentibacter sp. JX0631]